MRSTSSLSRAVVLAALALTTAITTAHPAAASIPSGTEGPVAPPTTASAPQGRVLVLGFDGADYETVSEMIAAGELPHLARLAEEGTFAPLTSTILPESATAWSAINTGQDASHNGVPGFVTRTLEHGPPAPQIAFQRTEARSVADIEAAGGVVGLLARHGGWTLTIGVGVGALLVFWLVFRLLLRIRVAVSLVLAALLGGAGAFAVHRAGQYVPAEIPGVVANPLAAAPFWEIAAAAGKPAMVMNAAMSWDRAAVPDCHVLCGLGVPDARGGMGDWFVYTTDELEFDKPPRGRTDGLTAGTVFSVGWAGDRIDTAIFGPENFAESARLRRRIEEIDKQLASTSLGWKEGNALRDERRDLEQALGEVGRVEVPLSIERRDSGVRVTIDGRAQDLEVGQWSDWYPLAFELNALLKVHALTRVKLLEFDGQLMRLYVDKLDIDPAQPVFWQPVSQPFSFSKELVSALGEPFETYGWACMTMPFKSKEVDAVSMMEDIEFTMRWREKVAREMLSRDDWKVFFGVFSTPDRVQHMMYQFFDPEHPLYSPGLADQTMEFFGETIHLSDAIPAIYRQVDRIVGWVMDEYMREGDTLLICADHGFQSFRTQFDVNAWLAREGYLVLKEGVSSRDKSVLAFVDWSKTRAYALGLGAIYLNLEGREPAGIVHPDEADKLLAEIRDKLIDWKDPRPEHAGATVVRQVHMVHQLHDGPYVDREGDLQLGLAGTYRIAWNTTLGSIGLERAEDSTYGPGPVLLDNTNPWSGDHISMAQSDVRGIFFSNRPVEVPEGGVHVLHVAPTALSAAGVPPPAQMRRGALRFR